MWWYIEMLKVGPNFNDFFWLAFRIFSLRTQLLALDSGGDQENRRVFFQRVKRFKVRDAWNVESLSILDFFIKRLICLRHAELMVLKTSSTLKFDWKTKTGLL